MNESAEVLDQQTDAGVEPAHVPEVAPPPVWRSAAMIAAAGIAALLLLFWPTLKSMVDIWWRSETFAHGFLIFPISGFLIWRARRELRAIAPRHDYLALGLAVPLGIIWLTAEITDVLVVKQLAFVGMLPAMVWLVLGWRVLRVIAFPMGFLVFAVPIGEGLIPPMMNFTADFTVAALQLSGIPVFRQGTFFSIPSGDWSVVEGCSGVRYLIASVTLGLLYAYLSYQAFWRRALFVALAVVVPVFANGMRAYMIVMIAHLSDMKLALGVDHFIYGWVFFGLVMMLLFWIGTFWREPVSPEHDESSGQTGQGFAQSGSTRTFATATLAGVLVLAVWPAWSSYIVPNRPSDVPMTPQLSAVLGPWRAADGPFTQWKPRYVKPSVELQKSYQKGADRVGVYLAYYYGQEQGAELVNSQNVMVVQKHPVWRQYTQERHDVRGDGDPGVVTEAHVGSDSQDMLVWHWYWVSGRHTANPYLGKLLEARARLFGEVRKGAGIVIYTPLGTERGEAREVLRRFVRDMLPAIEASLERAASG